jgi:hypothetical protein
MLRNSESELRAICCDAGHTHKVLVKLAAHQHSSSGRQTALMSEWVESQVKAFVKVAQNANSIIQSTSLKSTGEVSSTPPQDPTTDIKEAALPETSIPTSMELAGDVGDILGEIRGLKFGVLKIGLKKMQHKKRMTPNLMAQVPNVNQVKGNINSVPQVSELRDIRAELLQVTAKSSPLPVVSALPPPPPPLPHIVPQAELPVHCARCAVEDNTAALRRMAAIYAALVLNQHTSVLQALSLLQHVVALDPVDAAEAVVCTCHSTDGRGEHSEPPNRMAGTLLKTGAGMRACVKELLEQLLPVAAACGVLLAQEIAESAVLRVWAPEIAVQLREAVVNGTQFGDKTQMYSVSFKMPETFLKPFREEIDSKNEFKSQVRSVQLWRGGALLINVLLSQAELVGFYERERVYDEFSNLYFRFQSVNRGDLDGSATAQFFRTDLLTTGATVCYSGDAPVRIAVFHYVPRVHY